MKYEILLFDADATLLDFEAAERQALDKTFAAYHIPLTEELEKAYRINNAGLWGRLEAGEIQKDYVLHHRFQDIFPRFGIEPPAEYAFEDAYQKALGDGHQLMDGAEELLESLSGRCRSFIVTNGVAETQRKRFKASGLWDLTGGMFISEEIGYEKPDIRFFEYVFSRIPDLRLESTLIIGDSLTSDIQGGLRAGIDSCWFNPKRKNNSGSFIPSYEITSLKQVRRIAQCGRL